MFRCYITIFKEVTAIFIKEFKHHMWPNGKKASAVFCFQFLICFEIIYNILYTIYLILSEILMFVSLFDLGIHIHNWHKGFPLSLRKSTAFWKLLYVINLKNIITYLKNLLCLAFCSHTAIVWVPCLYIFN
jgi:hypothetical protein